MRVTVVGCSGSFAGPDSPASCYLVQPRPTAAPGTSCSTSAAARSAPSSATCRPDDLDAVVLSHLHPDHCVDLCGLYVTRRYRPGGPAAAAGCRATAPPARAERMSLCTTASSRAAWTRSSTSTSSRMPCRSTVGPFTVTPYAVNHPVEAYGYRVEAGGARRWPTPATPTPATTSPRCCTAPTSRCSTRRSSTGATTCPDIHLSGPRAAAAAVRAGGVRRLVLTHIPAWNDPEVCRAQAAAVWPGEVELARAGAVYEL